MVYMGHNETLPTKETAMQNLTKDAVSNFVSVVKNVDPHRKNSTTVRNIKRAGVILGVAAVSVGVAVAIRPVMEKLSNTFDK
jgi:hypothetical protein